MKWNKKSMIKDNSKIKLFQKKNRIHSKPKKEKIKKIINFIGLKFTKKNQKKHSKSRRNLQKAKLKNNNRQTEPSKIKKRHRLNSSTLTQKKKSKIVKQMSKKKIEKLLAKLKNDKKKPQRLTEKKSKIRLSHHHPKQKNDEMNDDVVLTQKKKIRKNNWSIAFTKKSNSKRFLKRLKTPKLKNKTNKKKERIKSRSKSKSSRSRSRSKKVSKKSEKSLKKPSIISNCQIIRPEKNLNRRENSAKRIQKFWRKIQKKNKKKFRNAKYIKTPKLKLDSYEELIPVCIKSTPKYSEINDSKYNNNNHFGSSLIFKEVSGMDYTSRTLIRLEETEHRMSTQTKELSDSILSNPNLNIEDAFFKFADKQVKQWEYFLKKVEKAIIEAKTNKKEEYLDKCFDMKRRGEMSIKILNESVSLTRFRKNKKSFKKKKKRSYLNFNSKEEYRVDDISKTKFEERITERVYQDESGKSTKRMKFNNELTERKINLEPNLKNLAQNIKLYQQEPWIRPKRDISSKVMSRLVSGSKNLFSSLSFKGSRMTNSMNLSRSKSIQDFDFRTSERLKIILNEDNLVKNPNFEDNECLKGRASFDLQMPLTNSRRIKIELDEMKNTRRKKKEKFDIIEKKINFNFGGENQEPELETKKNKMKTETFNLPQLDNRTEKYIVDETNVKLEESFKESKIEDLEIIIKEKKKEKKKRIISNEREIEQPSSNLIQNKFIKEVLNSLQERSLSHQTYSPDKEIIDDHPPQISENKDEPESEVSDQKKDSTEKKEKIIIENFLKKDSNEENQNIFEKEPVSNIEKNNQSKEENDEKENSDEIVTELRHPTSIKAPQNFNSKLVYHNKNTKNLDPLFNSSEIETISRFSSLESSQKLKTISYSNSPLIKSNKNEITNQRKKFKINKSSEIEKNEKKNSSLFQENNSTENMKIDFNPDNVKQLLENVAKKISMKEKKDHPSEKKKKIEEEEKKIKNKILEEKTEKITNFIIDSLVLEFVSEDYTKKQLTPPEEEKPAPQHNNNPIPIFSDIENILEYLKTLYHEINISLEDQRQIHQRLNTPIGPDNLQRLMMCASSSLNKDEGFDTIGEFEYEPILDIKLYISLEEKLRDTLYLDKDLNPPQMEREHILHKLIFDSLNEKLDHRRVFGLRGIPLNYEAGSKKSKNITASECAKILESSRNEIMQWAMMRNGVLPEKEPVLLKIPDIDAVEIVREETMLKLLKDYVFLFYFLMFLGW